MHQQSVPKPLNLLKIDLDYRRWSTISGLEAPQVRDRTYGALASYEEELEIWEATLDSHLRVLLSWASFGAL
jgi:hypothetical protein